MPLNFIGVVVVESVEPVDVSTGNVTVFTVVCEGSSGYSFDLKVSAWVDENKSVFHPFEHGQFQLEGKLTFKDGSIIVEALRFYPVPKFSKIMPPVLCGSGIFKEMPVQDEQPFLCSWYYF